MPCDFSAIEVWTQIPVASRLVEVNTKTGFSLTAGSYAVRASSTQYASKDATSSASSTITISSVTTTRTVVNKTGNRADITSIAECDTNTTLTNATTVTVAKTNATGQSWTNIVVAEFY